MSRDAYYKTLESFLFFFALELSPQGINGLEF